MFSNLQSKNQNDIDPKTGFHYQPAFTQLPHIINDAIDRAHQAHRKSLTR
jgi:hypothetical protein